MEFLLVKLKLHLLGLVQVLVEVALLKVLLLLQQQVLEAADQEKHLSLEMYLQTVEQTMILQSALVGQKGLVLSSRLDLVTLEGN
jgi:hypothetical protein